jgi:hypothetical protein
VRWSGAEEESAAAKENAMKKPKAIDAATVTMNAAKGLDVQRIERISNALVLLADGIDEITEIGQHDLDGKAALGFASIVRMCGEDLHMLTPDAKGEAR